MKLHYTPTYSSWLNQVELWFSKIQRDLIARGIFTSVPDLSRKLLRYIAHYNKAPEKLSSGPGAIHRSGFFLLTFLLIHCTRVMLMAKCEINV